MQIDINRLETVEALRLGKKLSEIDLVEPFSFNANFNWARPFGMLFTAFVIKQFRNKFLDQPFEMKIDSSKQGVSYASHMAFFKTISNSIIIGNEPGGVLGNDNYIPITKIDLSEIHKNEISNGNFIELGEAIENKAASLAKILSRNNKEIQALFTYLVREILRNIPEHSDSSAAWVCGQYWSNNLAEIAILDEGIGIKNSLQKNPVHREYICTDEDALECAIRAGISQAFKPSVKNQSNDTWANSGFGLYMVSEICKELDGSFCLASGNKYITLDHNAKFNVGETNFKGTAVKISISTVKLKNSREIITKIAKQGEQQAKNIRNAFRNASTPSKGLLYDLE